MGLGDWLDSVGRGAVNLVDHAGNAVGHAVGSAANVGYTFVTGDSAGGRQLENSIDGVSNAIFFDGTVSGTNPAQIYKWFHDGPGTGSYGTAETNLGSLKGTLDQFADHYAKANSALQDGWSGAAGANALQNVSTSHAAATALAQRAVTKQGAYGGQVAVFDSTKNSLVPVPDNPPPPNNPLTMNPISTASGAVTAAGYQAGTKNNQQAYTGYQPPTQTHLASIPQGDTAVTPGQSNDTGTTQQQGTGISEPGAYNPSFGRSQTGHTNTSQPPSSGQHSRQPDSPGGNPVGTDPWTPDRTNTGLADYVGPPDGGSSPPMRHQHMISPYGTPGGVDGGPSGGSVFGGGGGGYGGSGSGYRSGGAGTSGGAGGRAGGPGAGNSAGARTGAGEQGVAGRGAAPGGRGAAGQSGAGGAGAGGRGGKKEQDKEKGTAAYLITEEHGTEVVGDLPPSLPAGGVIG